MSERVKRRPGTTRVSRKNQVTIPVAALLAAHVEPGDVLQVRVDGDGRLLLIREEDPLAGLIGAFPGLSEATDLEGLRAIVGELQTMAQKSFTAATAMRFSEIAMDFHAALVEAAHNRALSAQFKALRFALEPVYARRTSNAIAKRVISADKGVLNRK